MLSIGKLSPGQDRYYLEQAQGRIDVVQSVADGIEDYYTAGSEARGVWLGTGSRELALGGAVDGEALRAVLAGLDPRSGMPLRTAAVRLAGFDLTFSAPKSVSVLFGVSSPPVAAALRDGHDRAASEAFSYLETNAAIVRRGTGGHELLRADGLIGAAFRHRTSRAGEPQLHTHVLVPNLARGSDGRWSALDGRQIYAHARAASFIYQAVLRSELTRSLGLEWRPVRDGIAELAGVPDEVIRGFSTRRAEIVAELAAHGTNGPRASEAAALATRAAKDRQLDPEALVDGWRERAAQLGLPAEAVERMLGRAQMRETTLTYRPEQLVSPAELTRERSSFTRRDVVQALCERVPADIRIGARTVEAAADRFLASDRVVALLPASAEITFEGESFARRDGRRLPVAGGGRRYTTPQMLALERRVVDLALEGRDAAAGVVDRRHLAAALARRPSLSDEQRVVVEALTRGGARVAVVAGRAGTGKTYALGAAHDAWRASGVPVIGAAVARRAAHELQDGAGIPATSMSALLAALERGEPLPARAVLVIDEAGMVGTRQLAAVADHVERVAGKLVLVGDHRQLPALEAGGAFRGLVHRGLAVELTENRRQAARWERTAVEHLRHGRAFEALDLYRQHGRINVLSGEHEARERLVLDWWSAQNPDRTVMIARRRSDVADLNARARGLMREAGRLGSDELRIARGRIAAGDLLLIRVNDSESGLCNGDRATVVRTDTRSQRAVLDCHGRKVVVGHALLQACNHRGEPAIAHGYAITGHAAQGLTVDRAYVLADAGVTREWAYTAMTRGREANHLYAARDDDSPRLEYAPADRDPPDPIARLAGRLARETGDVLALDQATDPSALADEARLAALLHELSGLEIQRHELALRHCDASARLAALERRRTWGLPGRRAALDRARSDEATARQDLADVSTRRRTLQATLSDLGRRHAPDAAIERAIERHDRARAPGVDLTIDRGLGLGR